MQDARAAVDAGADAIGVNLVGASKRSVDPDTARRVARALGRHTTVVGVVAGLSVDAMRQLLDETGLSLLQLHGDEPPRAVEALQPRAYKAVRVASVEDVARTDDFAGDRILVDAKVEGALGGTGATFDWTLVRSLARRRRLVLAGGLDPENVAEAVRTVGPWGVDVASGVEVAGDPRRKDIVRLRAFVEAARSAHSTRS